MSQTPVTEECRSMDKVIALLTASDRTDELREDYLNQYSSQLAVDAGEGILPSFPMSMEVKTKGSTCRDSHYC